MFCRTIVSITVLVCGLISWTPARAQDPVTYWYTGGEQTDPKVCTGTTRWDEIDNWKSPTGPGAIPGAPEWSYITTSADAHTPANSCVAEANVEFDLFGATSSDPYVVGPVYVGGWFAEFDAMHADGGHDTGDSYGHGAADAFGHSGTLNITDGFMESYFHGVGSPPCNYIRVGTRSARGELNQSGGKMSSCTNVAINYRGTQGIGIYRLTGGEAQVNGFNVGAQSIGMIDMTGGTVDTQGNTTVGRGFNHKRTGYVPGVGVLYQAGGDFDAGNTATLGENIGSHGALVVQGKPLDPGPGHTTDLVVKQLVVAKHGTGSVLQSGGEVVVDSTLALGNAKTGFGTYTLIGGRLEVTRYHSKTRVGEKSDGDGIYDDELGAGNFVVIGNGATIDLGGGFFVNHRSRISFVLRQISALTAQGSSVLKDVQDPSPIDARYAEFEEGALVSLDLQGEGMADAGLGETIDRADVENREILLVTTADGISYVPGTAGFDAQDLLDPDSAAAGWALQRTNSDRDLVAVFCDPGQTYGDPPCSGL